MKFNKYSPLASKSDIIDSMVRVDHAGEYGAIRIYKGQMDAVRSKKDSQDVLETLEHMADQEQEHLDYFSGQISQRRVRPSALMPLWHISGYVLGFVTAKMGTKAAMACTVAVEEVIADHYQEQIDYLDSQGEEEEFKEDIKRIRLEEIEHKDIGIENDAEETTAYPLLSGLIKMGCKVAIAIAKKV